MLKKVCPDDSILNPKTNRCVKKNGAIGKLLIAKESNKDKSALPSPKVSPPKKPNKKDVKPPKKLLTEADCIKIGKVLNRATNRCNKAKPAKPGKKNRFSSPSLHSSSSRNRKINAAKKIQRLAKQFIERKLEIKPVINNSSSLRNSPIKSPIINNMSSSSRKRRIDSFRKRIAAKKIQRLSMPFIKRVSFNIDDRIRIYKLYVKYLSKFKVKQCLTVNKKGDDVEYSLVDNKIKIVKKIGTKSNYGAIYMSKGTNTGELFRFASKIMAQTKDNKKELAILKKLNDIVISKKNPHFPIMYQNFSCDVLNNDSNLPEFVINKRYFINLNELASGDLKMFIHKEYDNHKNVNNAIAQIFIAILSLHNFGYTHNDTHWGNFLYHKINPGGYIKYNINGIDVYIENLGYLWVIWDFAEATELDNLNIFVTLEDYMKVMYAFNNEMHNGWVPNTLRVSADTRQLALTLSSIFNEIIKPAVGKRIKGKSFDIILFDLIINNTNLFILEKDLPANARIINSTNPYNI
jgi:hypothetical protein